MKKVQSMYFKKANTFIFSKKDFHQKHHSFSLKKLRLETENQVEEFTKKSKVIMTEYEDLKNDSENFLQGYKLVENKGYEEEIFKDQKKIIPFVKLISIYKNKGYKVPNISLKNNLFKPNILYENINQIKKHLMHSKIGYREKKEVEYLKKLYLCVKEKKKEKQKTKQKETKEIKLDLSPIHKLTNNRSALTITNNEKGKKGFLKIFNKYTDNLNNSEIKNYKKETLKLKKYNESVKSMIESIKPHKNFFSRRRSMFPFFRKKESLPKSRFQVDNFNQTKMNFYNIRRNKKPSSLISHIKLDLTKIKNFSKDYISRNYLDPLKDITNSTTLTQQSIFGKDNSISQLIETSGGVNDCMKVIRNTQKIINNYDFNNFRRMIQSRNGNEEEVKQIIKTIQNLDKKINHLDKDIVFNIEKYKSNL